MDKKPCLFWEAITIIAIIIIILRKAEDPDE